MAMIKDQWAESLEPGIREWFSVGYNRRAALREQLFNVQTSNKSAEHLHSFGAIGIDAWDNFENQGIISTVDYDVGYKTTFTNVTKALRVKIQREWVEDNLYNQVIAPVQQLGDSAALKMETDAASVFVNATSASHLGGDGVALASDSHPHSPAKSGTTQDNNYALALSATNVATVREAMMAFTDDAGGLVGVMPDLLIVPPELEDTAKTITQTMGLVSSMDNDINPQFGRFRYVVWHYLTDANAWFMVDSNLMRQSLHWFNRVPLSIRLESTDTTVFATYVARMRYSYGWSDWRWVGFSNPS